MNGVARGGRGGTGQNGASGANGGGATSNLNASTTGANSLTLSASSAGGAGGSGSAVGQSGNASANADGSSATGTLSLQALADSFGTTGGSGGLSTATTSGTSAGFVQTSSNARGMLFGTTLARATCTGTGGQSRSSNSYGLCSGGMINTLSTQATTSVSSGSNGTDVTESRTNVGSAAPAASLADSRQAAIFATGSPTNSDTLAVLAGNLNASASFNSGGSVMLGLMTLRSSYSSSSAGGASSSATDYVLWQIDSSSFSTKGVKLALLNPQATGNGFSQLSLTIAGPNGTISQSFTSLATAMAFFNDNVLTLGVAGTSFNLQITMIVTTEVPGDSFRAQMLLGTSPLHLLSAVSRKTHAGNGTYDVSLPLSGPLGVECRNGGGNHTLIFFFTNEVVSGSAMVSAGAGTVAGSPSFSGKSMRVELTGVSDAQTVTINPSNIVDEFGEGIAGAAVNMGALLGDANGDRSVNSGDALITRNRSGQVLSATNFRSDVNTDGFLNSADVIAVRARSGNFLP